jgi:hypothetical protein
MEKLPARKFRTYQSVNLRVESKKEKASMEVEVCEAEKV